MKVEAEIIRSGAGVILRTDLRTLELTGADRVRFLNGMVSNDVTKLTPGAGQLAVKPTNKGRVEALLRVRMEEGALYLDLRAVVADRIREVLEKFIVMDDCAIRDVSREVIGIYGPRARETLAAVGLDPGALAAWAFRRIGDAVVIRDPWLGVDGYEVQLDSAQGTLQKLIAAGAKPVSSEAIDAIRIEAGVPIDGADLGDDTIPLEARLNHTIDFEKGCYIGQETIARATNLGQVRHVLVGLDIGGDALPPRGAKIISSGKQTGEVTSSVQSPTLGRPIGLGYVRIVDDLVGNWLTIEADGKSWDAVVAALPFVPSDVRS